MEEKKVVIKKCDDCGNLMINNCEVEGKHPYEVGVDSRTDLRVFIPTGEVLNFLGRNVPKRVSYSMKARVCPVCGKIDLYADISTKEDE